MDFAALCQLSVLNLQRSTPLARQSTDSTIVRYLEDAVVQSEYFRLQIGGPRLPLERRGSHVIQCWRDRRPLALQR